MPILFGLFGLILIVSGVRGTVTQGNPSLVSLIKDDFTGTDPFWKWMLAILLIGAIGYVPNLRPISRAFMALVIVVFVLSNQGLFTQLQSVFTQGNAANSADAQASTNQANLQSELTPVPMTGALQSALTQSNAIPVSGNVNGQSINGYVDQIGNFFNISQ